MIFQQTMNTKNDKIRLGLIGCGLRLNVVVRELMKATGRAEVVALFDPGEDSIRTARELFNPQARVYFDYRELVRDPMVDWVMIGSWNCFHAEHVIAAFKAGKDVFCEKPLATTLEDCLAMRAAWQASGRSFTIGFTLRYSPHYVRVREILASGRIGKIVSMEFNETLSFNHGGYIHSDWRCKTAQAGSHVLEKCCHDIDLVNWFVGSVATRVASFAGLNFFRPENAAAMERIGPDPATGRSAYMSWKPVQDIDPFHADKDIVDNQVAILEFANGVRAAFHTNCNAGIPERRMYICGTEGALRADVLTGRIEVSRIGFETEIEDCSSGVNGQHGGGDGVLAQSLADTMLNGSAPRATLEDGLRAAITCFGIDEAMSTGRVVDMRPLWERAGISTAVETRTPAMELAT